MGNEEKARRLTRDEKYTVQQTGRFWKDWLYLKESASEDYFIVANKYQPSRTMRVEKLS